MKSEQDNLPKKYHQGSLSIVSKREKAIATKLLDINMLVAFKMDGEDLVVWAKELNRLVPPDEMRKLPFVLDCFKTAELKYDRNEGIQNIFRALRLVYEEDGKFKLRNQVW